MAAAVRSGCRPVRSRGPEYSSAFQWMLKVVPAEQEATTRDSIGDLSSSHSITPDTVWLASLKRLRPRQIANFERFQNRSAAGDHSSDHYQTIVGCQVTVTVLSYRVSEAATG